jgi:hypothetical protein
VVVATRSSLEAGRDALACVAGAVAAGGAGAGAETGAVADTGAVGETRAGGAPTPHAESRLAKPQAEPPAPRSFSSERRVILFS